MTLTSRDITLISCTVANDFDRQRYNTYIVYSCQWLWQAEIEHWYRVQLLMTLTDRDSTFTARTVANDFDKQRYNTYIVYSCQWRPASDDLDTAGASSVASRGNQSQPASHLAPPRHAFVGWGQGSHWLCDAEIVCQYIQAVMNILVNMNIY